MALGSIRPVNSGGVAVVVPDGTTTAGGAANRPERGGGHDFLPRWFSDQRPVTFALVRTLGVIVGDVLVEHIAQSFVADKPESTDTLTLHRPDPALGKCVEVGAVGWDSSRLDTALAQDPFPGFAELGVAVVDQIPAADLLKPAGANIGTITRDLSHIGHIRMLGHAQDLDVSGSEMDGKQHIVGSLTQPADDIDGEEVGGHELVDVIGNEVFPGRVLTPLWRRADAMAVQDGGNGSVRQADVHLPQLSSNVQAAPDGVVGRHLDNQSFDLIAGPWSPRRRSFSPELSGQHQAMPLADGPGLRHGGDLSQALPTDLSSSSGETLPPAVGEGNAMAFRQLLAVVAVFGSEEGVLSDQHLVLFDQDVGSDQTGEERQAVHDESLHVIAKEKAIPRPDAGEMGLRIVQQMQQSRPGMSACVRVCQLSEVALGNIAASIELPEPTEDDRR